MKPLCLVQVCKTNQPYSNKMHNASSNHRIQKVFYFGKICENIVMVYSLIHNNIGIIKAEHFLYLIYSGNILYSQILNH